MRDSLVFDIDNGIILLLLGVLLAIIVLRRVLRWYLKPDAGGIVYLDGVGYVLGRDAPQETSGNVPGMGQDTPINNRAGGNTNAQETRAARMPLVVFFGPARAHSWLVQGIAAFGIPVMPFHELARAFCPDWAPSSDEGVARGREQGKGTNGKPDMEFHGGSRTLRQQPFPIQGINTRDCFHLLVSSDKHFSKAMKDYPGLFNALTANARTTIYLTSREPCNDGDTNKLAGFLDERHSHNHKVYLLSMGRALRKSPGKEVPRWNALTRARFEGRRIYKYSELMIVATICRHLIQYS